MKILVTAAIILVIWYGFKFVGRVAEVKESKERNIPKGGGGKAPSKANEGGETVDLVACKVCGDYVSSAKTVSCGRDDCPYPG